VTEWRKYLSEFILLSPREVIKKSPLLHGENMKTREKRIEFILNAQKEIGFRRAHNMSHCFVNVAQLGCGYHPDTMDLIRRHSKLK
jgi:hypothetical protein